MTYLKLYERLLIARTEVDELEKAKQAASDVLAAALVWSRSMSMSATVGPLEPPSSSHPGRETHSI